MWTIANVSEVMVELYQGNNIRQKTGDFFWFAVGIISSIFFVLIIFLTKEKNKRKIRRLLGKIRAGGLPLIGNAFELVVPSHEILSVVKGWMDIYGPVVQGWVGRQVYIFVADPSVSEKILSSSIQIEKSCDYSFLQVWLGTGLLTSEGQKWHDRRKLLTPAFHFKILEQFLDIFNEESCTLVEILNEVCNSEHVIFDVFPYITRCTLGIICEAAMGEKINAQRNNESKYVKAVYEITSLILKRMTRPWLHLDIIYNLLNGRRQKKLLTILHGFTEDVIRRRKQERENSQEGYVNTDDSGHRRLAFLDLLLDAAEHGKVLSDLDIREEVDTFMFEGHDTTAACLGWTILLLASNPTCQQKVREELEEIFGNDKARIITKYDLSRMKYLECCIKEALRLYPSVPIFGRKLVQDLDMGFTRKGNIQIAPKNSIVYIIPFLIHRNPKICPDPNAFLPERFLVNNSSWKQPFNYFPFSAGSRNCIGQKFALMETKVILANVFRNFDITSAGKVEDVKYVSELILRPKDGIHVSLFSKK